MLSTITKDKKRKKKQKKEWEIYGFQTKEIFKYTFSKCSKNNRQPIFNIKQ